VFRPYCCTIAERKSDDTVLIVTLLVGEYGEKYGKKLGVGNGCAKGLLKVAAALACPKTARPNENGAERMLCVNVCPVGSEK
jgi:hypothetical protein